MGHDLGRLTFFLLIKLGDRSEQRQLCYNLILGEERFPAISHHDLNPVTNSILIGLQPHLSRAISTSASHPSLAFLSLDSLGPLIIINNCSKIQNVYHKIGNARIRSPAPESRNRWNTSHLMTQSNLSTLTKIKQFQSDVRWHTSNLWTTQIWSTVVCLGYWVCRQLDLHRWTKVLYST